MKPCDYHKDIHPVTNPETGQFERGAVVNFLKNLETGVSPEQRSYWLFLVIIRISIPVRNT